jgi:hypothetical protein
LVIAAHVGPGLLAMVKVTFRTLCPFGGDTFIVATQVGPVAFAKMEVTLDFSEPHLVI